MFNTFSRKVREEIQRKVRKEYNNYGLNPLRPSRPPGLLGRTGFSICFFYIFKQPLISQIRAQPFFHFSKGKSFGSGQLLYLVFLNFTYAKIF